MKRRKKRNDNSVTDKQDDLNIMAKLENVSLSNQIDIDASITPQMSLRKQKGLESNARVD